MKRTFISIFAGVLTGILCVGFAACNDNNTDEDWLNNRPEGEIAVVAVSDELAAAIAAYLDRIDWSLFVGDESYGLYIPGCKMVNSIDELPEFDRDNNSVERPAIDLESHTLVVGCYSAAHNEYIVWQGIVPEPEIATLNLVLQNDVRQDITNHFFWGLYPKISSESVQMNIAFKD